MGSREHFVVWTTSCWLESAPGGGEASIQVNHPLRHTGGGVAAPERRSQLIIAPETHVQILRSRKGTLKRCRAHSRFCLVPLFGKHFVIRTVICCLISVVTGPFTLENTKTVFLPQNWGHFHLSGLKIRTLLPSSSCSLGYCHFCVLLHAFCFSLSGFLHSTFCFFHSFFFVFCFLLSIYFLLCIYRYFNSILGVI